MYSARNYLVGAMCVHASTCIILACKGSKQQSSNFCSNNNFIESRRAVKKHQLSCNNFHHRATFTHNELVTVLLTLSVSFTLSAAA